MKKWLAVAVLLAFAAVAGHFSLSASGGTYLPPGNYGMCWGATPAECLEPDHQMFFTVTSGPPKSLLYATVTFTWDAESETYREPMPNGDSWSFNGVGGGTFSDCPTFPTSGPPVTTCGLVYSRD